jgi:aminoglycoside 6'-N-acetyltransferase
MSLYTFRAMMADDLPMIEAWLRSPEATQWWGKPDEQIALIREDFSIDEMRQWIVSCDGTPFAYAQAYEVHAWPQPHFSHLPQGAMAIDTFIGMSEMVGRGHGSAYLRNLAETLIAEGAPCMAIDPDLTNARAQKAYRNAGFRDEAEVQTDTGPVLLMIFRRNGISE